MENKNEARREEFRENLHELVDKLCDQKQLYVLEQIRSLMLSMIQR